MASVNLLPVAAIVALCGVCLMYLGQWRAQRRLRSVMELELSRIFEQIDLLRLDQLPGSNRCQCPTARPTPRRSSWRHGARDTVNSVRAVASGAMKPGSWSPCRMPTRAAPVPAERQS